MVSINKKGQDLSIGTLILIVLGIVVLVLLILGFSLGWENLWEKINIFGGGSSIGDVATACSLAVTQNNQYGYCQDFKKVKVDGKVEYLNCEDSRIQPSLSAKLDCTSASTKPESYNSWTLWYCNERLGQSDKDKGVKVNGAICAAAPKTFEQACKEAANDERASVQTATTVTTGNKCPNPDQNREVTVSSVTAPEGKICCVPTAAAQ